MDNKTPETRAKRASRGKGMMQKPVGRPRKHGAYCFLRTGIIPKGKEYLADMADAAIARMAEDLGGLDHLSGGQVVILREIRQLMIYKFIVDERLMDGGLFSPGPMIELQGPMNAFYLSCCNSIIRACALLGLDRKAGKEEDLERYLKRKYPAIEAKATPAAAPASPAPSIDDKGPVEIVAPGASSEGIAR